MSSRSELEETVAPFLDRQFVVTLPLNTIIVTFLVYGIYVVVFGICVSIFRRSKKDPNNDRRNKLYIWSTFLLFGLATASTAICTWYYYSQALFFYDMARSRDYEPFLEHLAHDDTNIARRGALSALLGLISLTSDLTVIHRCYTVWDKRKIIALPLLFAAFCRTCLGVTGSILTALRNRNAYNEWNWSLYVTGNRMALSVEVINAALSFLVTLLTAGRIWYISRQIRRLLGRQTSLMYRTVIAIIVESGLLCPLAIMIKMIIVHVSDSNSKQSAPIDFSPIVSQVAGIAPTLVIARARAGKSIESVDRTISTLQFTVHQDVEDPRESTSRQLQQVSISIGGLPGAQNEAASGTSEDWSRNLSKKE
ncbi:hypothetical protein Moror_9237 [Moniliophthora roreri MCA 2997]|uniref:Uncharacterized protein n=1 Tax=Moniliophthora roreri (strain MCA 2997) TaxID=1381753 RepID=V2WXK5_MONRO|nr:hypothetical protein Moror_9237 [Moniliophthora roreri MCA 2997]